MSTTTTWGRHRGSARVDAKGRRVLMRRTSAFGAIALVVTGGTAALAEVTLDNPTNLKAVGPISGEHGYPTWYEDGNNLRLEQCLDINDEFCDPVFLRGEMPNPDAPVSFPDNWPTESFYYLAGAEFDTSAGKAVLTAGLEATMANEAVRDGDQVVFGRLRFDIDFPSAGTFVVTHPYGVDTFEVNAAGDFRYVEDITPAPGNFGLALGSRISPFLIDADGMHTTNDGNKYVGHPGEQTLVAGSPVNTNYFSIDQVDENGGVIANVGRTDLFSLMGKVSTNSGIAPNAAILVEGADGSRYLDVFASTDPNESITVSGAGVAKTLLDAEGGRYFGRIALQGATPTELTFSNDTDRPVATKTIPVTDGVTISSATYDTATDALTVTATSTDQVAPPALTLQGFVDANGAPVTIGAGGTATVTTTAAPASVTVTSAGNGQDSAPVTVSGGPASQAAQTMAVISGPSQVLVGESVTLTNASLNATGVVWSEPAGQGLGVSGTADTVTFTAPATPGPVSVILTATGPAGTHSTTWPIEVLAEPPAPEAPVAVATASVTDAFIGQTVSVSGTDSTAGATYAWTQTSGTPVTFDSTAGSFSFVMPATTAPMSFQLVVTNANGPSQPVTVSVNQAVDVLTVTDAQYRADKAEWRFTGTAAATSVNTVRVYVQRPDGTKGAQIGSGTVDALGAWTFKVKGGVNPGTATRVIAESTRGGVLNDVPFTRR